MIDSGSRSQVRPLERFKRSRFGLLAIASFIIHNPSEMTPIKSSLSKSLSDIQFTGDGLLVRIGDRHSHRTFIRGVNVTIMVAASWLHAPFINRSNRQRTEPRQEVLVQMAPHRLLT